MSSGGPDPAATILAASMSYWKGVHMKRKLSLAVVGIAAVALLVAATSLGGSSATPALRGTVGPSFTIKLTKAGKVVKSLRAGTYRLTVSDRSAAHNFVLEREGGAERVITSLPFVGTKSVTVRLAKGVWKFYCEPHASVMSGRFAVGGASLSSARAATTADDHGGHGEPEPGDDRGGHGEPEPGDDHGGR
jgi:Copper binding proteins, plastocyanin/azurin family